MVNCSCDYRGIDRNRETEHLVHLARTRGTPEDVWKGKDALKTLYEGE